MQSAITANFFIETEDVEIRVDSPGRRAWVNVRADQTEMTVYFESVKLRRDFAVALLAAIEIDDARATAGVS